MTGLMKDLQYALRLLRRSPGFTAVAVLTLAVGIGLNTTLFSAVNAVALKPLRVRNGSSLRRVERWFQNGSQGDIQYAFSYDEFVRLRDQTRTLADVMAVSWPMHASLLFQGEKLAYREPRQRAEVQLVSENYFRGLAVPMQAGHPLGAGDYRDDAAPVAVLSYGFWKRELNAQNAAVGRPLKINGRIYTIAGITGTEFAGTANPPIIPDVWLPLSRETARNTAQDWGSQPDGRNYQLLGYPAQNAGKKQVEAEATVLIQQLDSRKNADPTTRVTIQEATFLGNTEDPRFQGTVVLVMAIVCLVLLIACANLANMLMARAAARQREISVRRAIGASRSRLLRQLLTESMVLALLGGALGILLSVWAGQLLATMAQQALQSYATLTIPMTPDWRVFLYTSIVATLTGLVFGLAPALRLTRSAAANSIRIESTASTGLVRSRLRGILVCGQVAVSMLFLVSAGLIVRGLIRSWNVNPGIETRSVYPIDPAFGSDAARAQARMDDLVRRFSEQPQVKSTALAERLPMMGTWSPLVQAIHSKAASGDEPEHVLANRVSSGYFATLGVALTRGRNFTAEEEQRGAAVAIVSEATAKKLWPGEDPIGKQFKLDPAFRNAWLNYDVIGVAKDVRTANLSRVDPGYIYLASDRANLQRYWLMARIPGDTAAAAGTIRDTVSQVDANLGRSMAVTSLEAGPVRIQRLIAQVLSGSAALLAGLALMLAAIGVYGVLAYVVSQREKEIGIRMALGARPIQVLWLVLQQSLRPVALGGAIGLVVSIGVAAAIKSSLTMPGTMDVLYGVSAYDPITWSAIVLFLGVVALVACWMPARRVTKVEPLVALRYE